jgi:hypothetical protein
MNRARGIRLERAALAAAASWLLSACGDAGPTHVELSSFDGPPGSRLEGDRLDLAVGTALVVEAKPREDGEPSTAAVEIESAAPFEVLRTSSKNRFVIVANRAGAATIRILAGGRELRVLASNAH